MTTPSNWVRTSAGEEKTIFTSGDHRVVIADGPDVFVIDTGSLAYSKTKDSHAEAIAEAESVTHDYSIKGETATDISRRRGTPDDAGPPDHAGN